MNFTTNNAGVNIQIPKPYLTVLNQVFEIERKLQKIEEKNSINRNVEKLKNYFANEAFSDDVGLVFKNPIGEDFSETRNDCEASISGDSTENLKIVDVIKPIIYLSTQKTKIVVQKAVVIVEQKK